MPDITNLCLGICLYMSDKYQYKLRSDLWVFIPDIFELLFVDLHMNNKSIIIGVIHRPNTYTHPKY